MALEDNELAPEVCSQAEVRIIYPNAPRSSQQMVEDGLAVGVVLKFDGSGEIAYFRLSLGSDSQYAETNALIVIKLFMERAKIEKQKPFNEQKPDILAADAALTEEIINKIMQANRQRAIVFETQTMLIRQQIDDEGRAKQRKKIFAFDLMFKQFQKVWKVREYPSLEDEVGFLEFCEYFCSAISHPENDEIKKVIDDLYSSHQKKKTNFTYEELEKFIWENLKQITFSVAENMLIYPGISGKVKDTLINDLLITIIRQGKDHPFYYPAVNSLHDKFRDAWQPAIEKTNQIETVFDSLISARTISPPIHEKSDYSLEMISKFISMYDEVLNDQRRNKLQQILRNTGPTYASRQLVISLSNYNLRNKRPIGVILEDIDLLVENSQISEKTSLQNISLILKEVYQNLLDQIQQIQQMNNFQLANRYSQAARMLANHLIDKHLKLLNASISYYLLKECNNLTSNNQARVVNNLPNLLLEFHNYYQAYQENTRNRSWTFQILNKNNFQLLKDILALPNLPDKDKAKILKNTVNPILKSEKERNIIRKMLDVPQQESFDRYTMEVIQPLQSWLKQQEISKYLD